MEWKEGGRESVVPPQEHDDAALDDVEPGLVLLQGLAQASSSPLAPPHKLHLFFNTLSLWLMIVGSEQGLVKECC